MTCLPYRIGTQFLQVMYLFHKKSYHFDCLQPSVSSHLFIGAGHWNCYKLGPPFCGS